MVSKIAGSNPAEAVGFFRPAFLRRGSKAVCPMSQICGMKRTLRFAWKLESQAKLTGHFSPNSVLY
jgi:hypothetical protein